MTGWLVCSVLMLVSFSKASVFSINIEEQIKEGIKKINGTEELLGKKVEEVNREINKISLYFSRAVNETTSEGQRIYKTSVQKVEKTIIAKFEKGLDSNTEITSLLHLLDFMETTKNELDGEYDTFKTSIKKVHAQKSNEFRKLKELFEFTENFSEEFYKGLRANIRNCKDAECVKKLVQAAETKTRILTNAFQKYVREMSNVSAELQDGHRDCISEAQKKFTKALKIFDFDIEHIKRTEGTDDLTDRFDTVIPEW